MGRVDEYVHAIRKHNRRDIVRLFEYGLTRRKMRHGLQLQLRHAMENGFPHYGLRSEGAP
jgi:hypothetical protein